MVYFKAARVARDQCPTCGAKVNRKDLLIDQEANVIVYRRKAMRLAPKMTKLIAALWRVFPNGIANDRLVFEIYGALNKDEPEWGNNTVSVYLCNHRKALRKMGLEVRRVSVDGAYGKRLAFTQDGPRAEAVELHEFGGRRGPPRRALRGDER